MWFLWVENVVFKWPCLRNKEQDGAFGFHSSAVWGQLECRWAANGLTAVHSHLHRSAATLHTHTQSLLCHRHTHTQRPYHRHRPPSKHFTRLTHSPFFLLTLTNQSNQKSSCHFSLDMRPVQPLSGCQGPGASPTLPAIPPPLLGEPSQMEMWGVWGVGERECYTLQHWFKLAEKWLTIGWKLFKGLSNKLITKPALA